jgi:DnaA-homolog protein
MAWQLPLGIGFRTYPSLAGFLPGPNAQALAAVRACVLARGEPFLYLWGGVGEGKSHLLQGGCELAAAAGIPAAYLPLAQSRELEPAICADLDELELVCIDDIDAVAGQPPWEEALFHLFNRLRERGRRLLVAARQPPAGLPLGLPDLRSRLASGLTLGLEPLDDAAKERLLLAGAEQRGLRLNGETVRYLLHHLPRDNHSLLGFLDTLDRASLAEQRRPTIPFIRRLLAGEARGTG